ncbi:MAG TPA: ADOP family duplicated permease [Vicinamibacterales bacterium]|nr:ADOP family duplicated permease [Vicinamibacterales bacterium]
MPLDLLREWLARAAGLWRPQRSDSDLEAELRAHVALAEDAGRPTARRAEIAPALESLRDQRGLPVFDGIARDVRQGLRALRRSPTFALVTIVTLALGIAAATTVFAVIDGVLLAPLPYPDAARVVAVWNAAPGAPGLADVSGDLRLSDSMYFTYAEQNRVFDAFGVWGKETATITGRGEPEEVRVTVVSDGVLQALGVAPFAGRLLNAADQRPGTQQAAILSYGYWQRRFGGDPRAVGSLLTVDAAPRLIVGVMPPRFTLADAHPDLILPVRFDRSRAQLPGFGWQGLARLKPGVTIRQADADLARMLPVWMTSWPAPAGVDPHVYEAWRITPAIRPLKTDIVGSVDSALRVLMATAGIVLLIACANVATLVLVRRDERQHELSVRVALGAGRARIVRALAVEMLLLAATAAALGAVASAGAVRVLAAFAPSELPRAGEIALGVRELAFAAGAAVLAALAISVTPALRAMPSLTDVAAGAARTTTDSRIRQRGRNLLIVAQLAMALVLLGSSGLMFRTFRALHQIRPGFTDPAHQLTLRIAIPDVLVPDDGRVAVLEHDIVDRIKAVAGVESVGFATTIPMAGTLPDWDVVVPEGSRLSQSDMPPLRLFKMISPGYFRALGTALIAGRDLSWGDLNAGSRVVLVSENLARELWGSAQAAIGRRIQTLPGAPWHVVVGVVEDVRENGAGKPAPAIVYWPAYEENPYRANRSSVARNLTMVVRTPRAGTASLLGDVERAVWSVRADLAIAGVQTMDDIYVRSMAQTSFTMTTLCAASAMALLLALVGVYGVVSYSVSRRMRELGIRVALGGQPRSLVLAFVRWGLLLAAFAIPAGLVAAVLLNRLISSLLFGVKPLDPLTYGSVVVVLLAAAAAASYLPARKILSLNPVHALNH